MKKRTTILHVSSSDSRGHFQDTLEPSQQIANLTKYKEKLCTNCNSSWKILDTPFCGKECALSSFFKQSSQ